MIKNLELYTTVHINIMFKKSLYIFLVCLASKVHGHLILNIPEVWGIDDGTSLEQPLDTSTANPVCAGRSPENNGVVNFEAGQTYEFDVSCGEKDINSGGCLVGDWHSGDPVTDYSGCALGISYDGHESQDNYKYISYSKDCGKRGEPSSFTITTNVQDCERCVCSWSWAPSRQYSSPGQFYHNCFYCSISGGKMNVTMRPLDFINIRGAQYQDATYNSINPSDIYDDSIEPEPEQPEPESEQPEPESEQPGHDHDHDHEQPKDDEYEYDLYKQFKEYQEYKKLKESLDKDCDHEEEQYEPMFEESMSTPTPTPDTFIKDGKLCRYKTITKTICKPTNYLV